MNNAGWTTKRNIFFISLLFFGLLFISVFNYIVDPYYILRESTIKGFNNLKIHKLSNKRTILYSDIKINHNNKNIAFTGNCLLSAAEGLNNNIAFYPIPMVKMQEAYQIVQIIHSVAPNIKKIYLGLFFDEIWNDNNAEITDSLGVFDSKNFNYKDFINLFFSWNTTKYSLETVFHSVKNKGKNIYYIYPYKELVNKSYKGVCSLENVDYIKKIYDYTKKNGISLIIYYSPIHITKKMDIYLKGQWENNQKLKKQIAQITPFYDYSFLNEYNFQCLDENNTFFVDSIHPNKEYNNIVVKDLLSDKKNIGKLITLENVDFFLTKETTELESFMKQNNKLTKDIKNLTKKDGKLKIRKEE